VGERQGRDAANLSRRELHPYRVFRATLKEPPRRRRGSDGKRHGMPQETLRRPRSQCIAVQRAAGGEGMSTHPDRVDRQWRSRLPRAGYPVLHRQGGAPWLLSDRAAFSRSRARRLRSPGYQATCLFRLSRRSCNRCFRWIDCIRGIASTAPRLDAAGRRFFGRGPAFRTASPAFRTWPVATAGLLTAQSARRKIDFRNSPRLARPNAG
jgi:hypothetical protein